MYQLLDTVPDDKIAYIIGYIQGLTVGDSDMPNDETLTAFRETDEMQRTGNGQKYDNLNDLWKSLEDPKNSFQKIKTTILKGNYKSRRECHIAPDWLLIYENYANKLYLDRTGTHSDLFKIKSVTSNP